MTEYDGENRPLTWDLIHPLVGHAVTESDGECEPSLFVWPDDPNERVFIPFSLSLNEYNILASAIDVGAEIAFGEDAIKVNWLWLRNMRCNVPICAAIISCLETSTELQDALRGFMANEVYGPSIVSDAVRDVSSQQSLSPNTLNQSLFKPSECGLGYVYSQTVTSVQTLHTLSMNVFGELSVGSNPEGWGSIFAQIFPLSMNAFFPAFIMGMAQSIVDTVQTAYLLQWEDTYIDQLTCGLFCIAKVGCSLSINDIVQYYIDRSGLSISENPFYAFSDVLLILQNGTWIGHPVELMHLLMATAMRLDMTIVGIDFGLYGITITASGDLEDNGYLTECADCDPYVEFVRGSGGGGDWSGMELEFLYNELPNISVWRMSTTFNGFQWSAFALANVGFELLSITDETGLIDSTTPPIGGTGGTLSVYSNVEEAVVAFTVRVRPS